MSSKPFLVIIDDEADIGDLITDVATPRGFDESNDSDTVIDSVDWHRALAWFHGAAMAATVASGVWTLMDPVAVPALGHGIAGGMSLGLLALSAGVI
ncbi:MAG: hypothetical protein EBZ69_08115, partial [Alphaproteobacteria bacterium]|nr:hypothetical protein [Alphaproteobacteria bacterium]